MMENRSHDTQSQEEVRSANASFWNGCIGGLLGIFWGNVSLTPGSFFEFIRILAKCAYFDSGLIGEFP
jgi:hypothetical protein